MLQNLKSHVDVDFVGDCNGLLIVMLILMATMLMLIVRLEDFLVLVGKWCDAKDCGLDRLVDFDGDDVDVDVDVV